MARSSAAARRGTPYLLDRAFVQMHRSPAGVAWRFRTELTTLITGVTGVWELDRLITLTWTVITLNTVTTLVVAVPWARRQVIRRACCVLSRHRIHRVCYETRMHTRTGRLPLVLRITPTHVGERAIIWCRAGICREDFELNAAEIAAACYARQARIEGHKRWSQIVVLDIVRRDTLAPHHVIPSALPSRGRAEG